jgi:broad specificity phosphatase PhoE
MQMNLFEGIDEMKIGLVRHFKVLQDYPYVIKMVSQSQILEWFNEYDRADVEASSTEMGGMKWDICFTSDLHRARKTAAMIYKGRIIEKEDLREFKMYPIFKKNVRLPFLFWPVLIRVAWYFNLKSQIGHKLESLKKVKEFVDEIVSADWENILIVSHAALMMYLRKELIRRGFRGPKFRKAENGRLYVYEI